MITIESLKALKAEDIILFARKNNIEFRRLDGYNCAVAIIGLYFGYGDYAYNQLMSAFNRRLNNISDEVFLALDKIEDGFEGYESISDTEDHFYKLGERLAQEVEY